MRSFLLSSLCLMLFAAGSAAQAKVAITVDKDAQLMIVAVDGVERYQWPVSSGNPSHETPNGSFRAFRMEEDHYSKEFDEAPMPHSIFFTKVGHAIHGTDSENRLGTPASHGCVRLSRANASTLYALVESEGVLNTTVTLTGSSQVALARNPPRTRPAAVARRDVAPPSTSYDAAGNPIDLAPQRPYAPQQIERQQLEPVQPLPPPQTVQRPPMPQQADNGYIYPADGSTDGQRYPAPRGYRRQYDVQAQQQYYDNRGTAPQVYAPQVYAPRQYYRQRGFFTD